MPPLPKTVPDCVKYPPDKEMFYNLPVKLKKKRDNIVCWGLWTGDVLLFGGHDEGEKDVERVSRTGETSEIVFPLTENHQYIE